MISGREAYGAYTKFATETANLAITVAKSCRFPAEPPQGGVYQGLTAENEKMRQIW
ncbi:MAG: hypothetical protein IKH35_00200 [Prevotella sp.]|nr:hypothetical protein [Prevotella sp.]